MYHLYKKEKNVYDAKVLLGDYKDIDDADKRIEEELAKDPNFKYSLEETTGHVNNYGDLIVDIIEEN
ncbi:hypothetical protein IJ818_08130 [bacterium]|nr:hypothetical protein [bacterium]